MANKLYDKVHWESNSLVRTNSSINPKRIIPKSKTEDFPYGAVTVRIQNQKKGVATVYFKGEIKTRSFGSGKDKTSYNYCDSEARITLPLVSSWNNEAYNYSMQGTLPRYWSLFKAAQVCDWIRHEVEDMTGAVVKDIPFNRG